MRRRAATPGIGKRLLSLIYEALLLIAVILLAGGIALVAAQLFNTADTRLTTQVIAIAICAGYFSWQWHGRGQTLPMKTWRIRLETTGGNRVSIPRTLLRVALALPGYMLLGISILWAFVDRDRQFLHDRLAGTRLVETGHETP